MSKKGKKILFVFLDIVILGFFGFYLSLNLRYKVEEPGEGDFIARALFDNGTSNSTIPSGNTTVTCGANAHVSGGKCVCNDGYSPNSDGRSCYCPEVTASITSTPGVYSSPGEMTSSGASNGVSTLTPSYSGGEGFTIKCVSSGFGKADEKCTQ